LFFLMAAFCFQGSTEQNLAQFFHHTSGKYDDLKTMLSTLSIFEFRFSLLDKGAHSFLLILG